MSVDRADDDAVLGAVLEPHDNALRRDRILARVVVGLDANSQEATLSQSPVSFETSQDSGKPASRKAPR